MCFDLAKTYHALWSKTASLSFKRRDPNLAASLSALLSTSSAEDVCFLESDMFGWIKERRKCSHCHSSSSPPSSFFTPPLHLSLFLSSSFLIVDIGYTIIRYTCRSPICRDKWITMTSCCTRWAFFHVSQLRCYHHKTKKRIMGYKHPWITLPISFR